MLKQGVQFLKHIQTCIHWWGWGYVSKGKESLILLKREKERNRVKHGGATEVGKGRWHHMWPSEMCMVLRLGSAAINCLSRRF